MIAKKYLEPIGLRLLPGGLWEDTRFKRPAQGDTYSLWATFLHPLW